MLERPFRRLTYVTTHSPTLTSFHLRHSSFSKPSAPLPTSQLILQPFRCFTYVIGTSPTSPGEPPMPLWWCLIYPWWFCNLQWLRNARVYEKCKLALELKRLKTPALKDLKWSQGHQRGGEESIIYLVNRVLRTSPKFTTSVNPYSAKR